MPDSAAIIPARDSPHPEDPEAVPAAEDRVDAVEVAEAGVVAEEAVVAEVGEAAEGDVARIRIGAVLTTASSRASAIGGTPARSIPDRFSST
jgi:hypothetical protein